MSARCEIMGNILLPLFRSYVAKELVYTYALTQTEAAQKLQTSQAAVSQYLSSKRAIKGIQQFNGMLPKIQSLAAKAAWSLAKGETTWGNISLDFCRLCSSFFEEEPTEAGSDYSI